MKKIKKQKRKSLCKLCKRSIRLAKMEKEDPGFRSLNEALLGGTSADIRQHIGNRADVYRITRELRNFPKQRKEIADSIDIYLNSTFAKSFNATFSSIMLAFIAPAMKDLIESIIKEVFLNITDQETSSCIEFGVTTFTLVAMAIIIAIFCKEMLKLWNESLDLKRDLLLLKSLLKEQ